MRCEQCRNIVPDENIRMVPKKTYIAVCNICLGGGLQTSDQEIEPANEPVRIDRMDEPIKKSLFLCARCNYRFKHNSNGSVKLYCPWCGQADKAYQIE